MPSPVVRCRPEASEGGAARSSMNDVPRPMRRAWLTLGLLWGVVALNYIARLMLTTMHGSIVETIPITSAQFGLLTSVFLWVYGAFQPLAGFLGDRFDRGRLIIFSTVAWSVVTLLTAFARTLDQLLVMRTLMAISETLYMPAALALIADYHRGSTRSLANGIHMTGIYVGCSLAGVGGWLAEIRSWHYAFAAVGTAGLAYGVLLIFFLRSAPREPAVAAVAVADPAPGFGRSLADLFSQRSYVLMVVFYGLLGSIEWVVLAWIPTFVQEHFHLRQGAAGFSASGFLNIAALVGSLIGGAWTDRWARRNARGRFFVPCVGLAIAGPALCMTGQMDHFGLAVAGLALHGLTVAFATTNIMPMLCVIVDSRHRATAYGVANLVNTIGGGLAIYLTGVLMDAHFALGAILAGSAGGLLLCAGLLLLVRTPASTSPAAGAR
jgi:MFS family permease